jgi:hypothetical protein
MDTQKLRRFAGEHCGSFYGCRVSGPAPPVAVIHAEFDRARGEFRALVAHATPADLARRSEGTDWTNRQLLFHMLFGYLIVRNLRVIVSVVGRAPGWVQRGFAGALDATTPVFHRVNYWGSCGGGALVSPARADAWLGRAIRSLHRHLDRESEEALGRRMRFPTRWDPYFTQTMSVAEVYHYATLHFDHHRGQLTLPGEEAER